MGITKRFYAGMLIFLICTLLIACECNNISLYGISISQVQAHSGAAYYLSNQGRLYCSGVDTDSASFVVYLDETKGLVAENVKSFGEYTGGGYYIDFNNNLYIWNERAIPLLGYYESAEHLKILENVIFASTSNHCIIYIDINSCLYLIGTFNEENYGIDNPKLLSKDVVCADVNNSVVLWVHTDGSFNFFGDADRMFVDSLNDQFLNTSISDIHVEKDSIIILSDQQLWYYGDYSKLITGKETQMKTLTLLASDISAVSCSARTVMALAGNGNALLWGRCVSNNTKDVTLPVFDFYESYCITQTAKNIFVSDSCVCFIDKTNRSNIYYASGWPIFYGNSTKDPCVGIKREPSKWVALGTVLCVDTSRVSQGKFCRLLR
jgi:hypothetical protein